MPTQEETVPRLGGQVYGPPAPPVQYEQDAPTLGFGTVPRYDLSLPVWLRDMVIMAYAGKPIHQAFKNVHSVAESRQPEHDWDTRLGDVPTQTNPMYGLRLGYRPNPYLELSLEGWRQNADMTKSPATDQRSYDQLLQVLAANIAGRYPTPYGTPYAGVGPALMWSQQSDGHGASPPAVDLGAHLFGGLELPLTERLFLLGELKGLLGAIKPKDQQGAYRGDYDQFSGVLGMGYKFKE